MSICRTSTMLKALRRSVSRPVASSTSLSSHATRFVALPSRSRAFATETTGQTIPKAPASQTAGEPRIPYFVGRNNLHNFGVYHRTKRGGNYELTLVKNIEGDIQALKRDLATGLNIPVEKIAINNTTGHLEVRGHRKEAILTFLHSMGF